MAQQKKTEAVEHEELPELSVKQHRYVLARLEGLNHSDSVRAATDTSNWSPEAIWAEGWKLENHPLVRLWLNRLRAALASDGKYTLEAHCEQLQGLAERAETSGNYGAAVNATVSMGKAVGLYIERIKDETPRESAEDIMARGIEMFGDAFKSTPLYERLQARVTKH